MPRKAKKYRINNQNYVKTPIKQHIERSESDSTEWQNKIRNDL